MLVFMSMFTNMKVVDQDPFRDNHNTLPDTIETPIDITYTPRERLSIEKDYDAQRPASDFDTMVPRFACSISSITYDPTRALNFYRQRRIRSNLQQYQDRMPVPYNIGVNLDVLCKYEVHLHQIVENIVPYFSPYILIRIKENLDLLTDTPREIKIDFSGDAIRDIPIDYADVEKRIIKGQLSFVIRGWIYKPMNERNGLILNIPISFWNHPVDRDVLENLLCSFEVSGPNWVPPSTSTI